MQLQRAFFKGGWEKKYPTESLKQNVGKMRHVSLALECEGSVSAWVVYQREVKR